MKQIHVVHVLLYSFDVPMSLLFFCIFQQDAVLLNTHYIFSIDILFDRAEN